MPLVITQVSESADIAAAGRPSNTPERIRVLIEREIERGHLAPGAALDEKALARTYAVSRTPVREALLMLAAQKLVNIVPRLGTFVHRPAADELIALLEYLGEAEGVAARLAASRMAPEQRARLRALHEHCAELSQRGDRVGYEAANLQLHDAVHQGGGNAVIVEQIVGARRRLASFRRNVFDRPGRLQASHAEHGPIVDAVCAGDAQAAADAMRDHIIGKGKAYADLVLANG
ncbi:GntR family transcriptional regulator [Bordetella genomosp. 13]|uniref:GntR family transcriptional regulator n=1 Tax=Bordetella genomosp. 13 TaxID=463040 RepID=UPI00119FB8A6|nr:GntR family transcriptional regulator [Bordetella genomosp. 13]